MNRNDYLASILLSSDSYEAELNEMILGELRNSPSVSEMSSPRILPGPPNRVYFLDRFFQELARLPFSVEIIDSEQVFQEQIDGYEDGRPDPVDPGGTWRAMSLDVRLELGGERTARLFLRESPCERLVQVTFAFDSSLVRGGRWHKEDRMKQDGELPRFREFLLALTEAYPAIVGTLGLELDAVTAGLPHEEFRLENGMWLHRLDREIRRAGHEHGFDFIIVNGAPWGWDRPFVYDRIESRGSVRDSNAGRPYYDLHLVEEIRVKVEQAEQAYGNMYESKRPKDDRDDALLFLSKSIRLATDMGLEREAARLKERYEHIDGVFNSQFRRI
jgi:hypothetical protein